MLALPDFDAPEERRLVLTQRELDSLIAEATRSGEETARAELSAAIDAEAKAAEAELRAALQDLGFTFYEARHHMLANLRDLVEQVVRSIVPGIAHHALAEVILAEVLPIAESQTESPISIVTAPGQAARLRQALVEARPVPVPINVESDSALQGAEAFIRTGVGDLHLDLGTTAEAVTAAVDRFFNLTDQEAAHV